VEITQNSLNEFANSLPEKARTERVRIVPSGFKFRDKIVRANFGNAIDKWFREHFGVEDSTDYVYVEGWRAIPKKYRGSPFFGAKMYPDAALIIPDGQFKIAIELDHGKKGSQIRNALAKASFSVGLGEYNRALVLFFVDPPKSTIDFSGGSAEEKILKSYEDKFRTTLHLL